MSPSPYTITHTKNWVYEFNTDSDHNYQVYFDNSTGIFPDEAVDKFAVYIGFGCYPPLKPLERDHNPRIGATIMFIIANFFVKYPAGLLAYVCSSADGQERSRQILFSKWYSESPLKTQYKLTKRIIAGAYCGLLYDFNHPQLELIQAAFDDFDFETKPEVSEEESSYALDDEDRVVD